MLLNAITVDLISNPRAAFVEELSDSCIELFGDHGLKIKPTGPGIVRDSSLDQESALIGFIGVTADYLRASLVTRYSPAVLRKTFPAKDQKVSDQDLRNWVGELSNLLSYRFKTKLLSYGCKLIVGVPTVVQGCDMEIDLPQRSEVSSHRFVTECGEAIMIKFSTLIKDNLVLYMPDNLDQTKYPLEREQLFF